MVNNTSTGKLDESVKQTLSNYEAEYDASDWSRMESMLDAAPKAVTFKWSYVLNTFIGLAVCGGIYLAYVASTGKSSVKENTATTSPSKSTESPAPAIQKPVPVPVVNNTAVPEPMPASTVSTTPVISNTSGLTASGLRPKPSGEAGLKKDKDKENAGIDAETLKNVRMIGMGNEPVFGDMLDSSRGIVGETQETEETIKEAAKHKDLPAGWNTFMLTNLNPDSIKSNRARMKKDSLKSEK
jgi:hypothetical protein